MRNLLEALQMAAVDVGRRLLAVVVIPAAVLCWPLVRVRHGRIQLATYLALVFNNLTYVCQRAVLMKPTVEYARILGFTDMKLPWYKRPKTHAGTSRAAADVKQP